MSLIIQKWFDEDLDAPFSGNVVIDLTTATFLFVAWSVQPRFSLTFSSSTFAFAAQSVRLVLNIALSTASFLFSPQMVTVFAAKLIDLTAAALTFTGQAFQLRLLVTLTTPVLSFVAQMVEVTAGAAQAGYNSLVGFLRNIGVLKGR